MARQSGAARFITSDFRGAARRLAAAALEELNTFGVAVTLEAGRARFRSIKPLPPAAKRIVETHGDLIETYLT